jgi:hypothetical protein
MEDKSQEEVSPGSLKELNSGRKRRINMDRWRDINRNKLKDARKTPKSRKGKQIDAKYLIKAREWNNAVKLYDFRTFNGKETSYWCLCNSCNNKYSDPISCIGGKCLLFALPHLIQCYFFTEVHQKFLCSGHIFLPYNRDFAFIEKRKKVSYVMVPSQWKNVIAESGINKPFTVVEIEQGSWSC